MNTAFNEKWRFIGRVEDIDGEVAYVSLLNCETQERLTAQCDPRVLDGTKIGFEFEVIVKGKSIKINRLEPNFAAVEAAIKAEEGAK